MSIAVHERETGREDFLAFVKLGAAKKFNLVKGIGGSRSKACDGLLALGNLKHVQRRTVNGHFSND